MRALLVMSSVALAVLQGCSCGDSTSVLVVGKQRWSFTDVQAFCKLRGVSPESSDCLELVTHRAVLAEAARREGLDSDPAVKARLLAVSEEALASALLEKESLQATSEQALRTRETSSMPPQPPLSP